VKFVVVLCASLAILGLMWLTPWADVTTCKPTVTQECR
jgi:hypothetical protein